MFSGFGGIGPHPHAHHHTPLIWCCALTIAPLLLLAAVAGEGGAGASSGAAQWVQLWGEPAPSQGGEAGKNGRERPGYGP